VSHCQEVNLSARSTEMFLLFFTLCLAHKPIFFLHGINGDHTAGNDMKRWLGGQTVVEIPLFENIPGSWNNLPTQVHIITNWIELYTKSHDGFENGYHLVCHSQGALICRCISEYWDRHNIDTLVSLAGPQLGVYADSYLSFMKNTPLEKLTRQVAWRILYKNATQFAFSVAQLWMDPKHVEEYLQYDTLLPDFNGELEPIPRYKENFLRLRKAVFLTGDMGKNTNDGGIDPWFSGVFSYYDKWLRRIDTKDMKVYADDTFGLKTMDQRGDLTLHAVQNIHHGDWIHNYNTFNRYVRPWVVADWDDPKSYNVSELQELSESLE